MWRKGDRLRQTQSYTASSRVVGPELLRCPLHTHKPLCLNVLSGQAFSEQFYPAPTCGAQWYSLQISAVGI